MGVEGEAATPHQCSLKSATAAKSLSGQTQSTHSVCGLCLRTHPFSSGSGAFQRTLVGCHCLTFAHATRHCCKENIWLLIGLSTSKHLHYDSVG